MRRSFTATGSRPSKYRAVDESGRSEASVQAREAARVVWIEARQRERDLRRLAAARAALGGDPPALLALLHLPAHARHVPEALLHLLHLAELVAQLLHPGGGRATACSDPGAP